NGLPHEHLGASHVCKHYLDPAEAWEDPPDRVEPELRPMTHIARIKLPRRSPDDPDRVPEGALPHLDLIAAANERGYTAAVNHLSELVNEPPEAWFQSRGGHIRHVGVGVLAIVKWWRQRWELVTAFRALRYPFIDLPLPTDPYSRRSRAIAAEKRATR